MHVSFGKVSGPTKWQLVLAVSDFCCWKLLKLQVPRALLRWSGFRGSQIMQHPFSEGPLLTARTGMLNVQWGLMPSCHANSKHEICARSAARMQIHSTHAIEITKHIKTWHPFRKLLFTTPYNRKIWRWFKFSRRRPVGNIAITSRSFVNGTIKDGIMTFELETKTTLWFWPQGSSKLGYRTGPSDQDAFAKNREGTTINIFPGDSIQVRELRGSWIRCDGGWLPLIVGSNKNFVRRDPALIQLRNSLQAPELQPVSTGFARGRAFRAKKLRNFGLSCGIEDDVYMHWFTGIWFNYDLTILLGWISMGRCRKIVEMNSECGEFVGCYFDVLFWPVQPRKVKLSRGGAEGNQAFVKDMETEENYVQPRMKFLESELRSDVWGVMMVMIYLKHMIDDDWYDEWELKEALQPIWTHDNNSNTWNPRIIEASVCLKNILRLETAIQWAIRGGMGFKTLAACCEIFQQNQPSDFLGTAVQCAKLSYGNIGKWYWHSHETHFGVSFKAWTQWTSSITRLEKSFLKLQLRRK